MGRNKREATRCENCDEQEQGVITCVCKDGHKIKGCGKRKPLNEFYQGERMHKPQCVKCLRAYGDKRRRVSYKHSNSLKSDCWEGRMAGTGFEITMHGTVSQIRAACDEVLDALS